jgi:uncharacterized membrane protein (UPF0127 family)
VQTITIAAVAAAAAAGIIGAVLYFGPLFATADPGSPQGNATGVETPANSTYRQVNVTLSNFTLVADIADTNELRSKGLSVKDTLNETEGMLFVFSTEREHSFWMKGMKFPIDIIWIDDDKEVVHVEHSLEPCAPNSFCQTYKPDRDSLYVLETVAGFAQRHNVTDGTYVDFVLEEEE